MGNKYTLRKGEDIDKALKRLRRKLKKDGLFTDIRKNEYYEKPSERRKREESAAKRRNYLNNLED